MAHDLCPVWAGYLLASPFRRLFQDPYRILSPYVREGNVVLEVGPAMGFFSLPMAVMSGETGRIVCVDLQQGMLDRLRIRARKAGLSRRIETRVCAPDSLGVADLAATVDFALAFAMVHEVPNPPRLFREVADALKPGGRLLVAEPKGHVDQADFDRTLDEARRNGFEVADRPAIRASHAAVLVRG